MTRWGLYVMAHRWVVLIVAVGTVSLAGLWGIGVVDRLSLGGYTDPGSESAQVERLVEERLGRDDADLVVSYRPTDGRSLADIGPAVAASLAQLDQDLLARTPLTYWTAPEAARSSLQSFDGTKALAVLTLSGDENARIKAYREIAPQLELDGVTTRFAGVSVVTDAYNEEAKHDLVRAETVSFPILLILLLLVFGSVVSAAVPLCIGGLAILGSLAALRVIAMYTEVSVFATNIASLIGLGMAIDYSLFVVTRFREELRSGAATGDAVRRTVETAGRTILFSAILLFCAFVGVLVFPQPMVRSLAFGGMAAVAVAATVSLTALPAALGILGPRINALAWRRGAIERGEERAERFWGGVATKVMRRPATVAIGVTALLAILSLPLLGITIGDLDHTGLPPGDPARIAIDDLHSEFPLANSGVTLVVQATNGVPPSLADVAKLSQAVGRVDGVHQVFPAGGGTDFTVLEATLEASDVTPAARQTLDRIRAIPAPAGTEVRIGGPTALSEDGITSIDETIPTMIAIVIAVTLVVLTVMIRSIVLPIKAVAMAGASLAASFGILTWIFVDGHGADLLGVTTGPMYATMAILIIVVVFGVSTDYEIFLLSRMSEAHDQGADTEEAVRVSIARTGRVVTAAALLLIAVAAAFALSGMTMMRLVGVGIIVALVIDATLVRMLLVPSLVKLMGPANWWAPRLLSRPRRAPDTRAGERPAADTASGDAEASPVPRM